VPAQLRTNGGTQVYAFPLACTDTSTFIGSLSVPSGVYDVWVVAVQANDTNVGFARTTLTVV
jgi:hypothetical protein